MLDQAHPSERWNDYLRRDVPDWDRIALSGFSQGAGMAAYIAKRERVARVVLFSGPWDYYTDAAEQLAPWLGEPSVTPAERWFAVYHQKEKAAALLKRAYQALRVPPAHIRVLTGGIPDRLRNDANRFHASTVTLPLYAPMWADLMRAPSR